MKPHLHQLAELAGATVLGETPQFLFSEKQLREFIWLVGGTEGMVLADLADRLEKAGHKPVLTV